MDQPLLSNEDKTYEYHKKKASKNNLILLICLLIVVAILGSLFAYVACSYNATDLSLILTTEDIFLCDSGFLFPVEEDYTTPKNFVASYNLNTGELMKYEIKTMDLGDYGLEGEFSYFRYQPSLAENAGPGRILSAKIEDVALSRANTETLFVVRGENGKKYLLDTTKKNASPLFEKSKVKGVDPYAKSVTDFSHNGLYAFGLQDGILQIYVRSSESSFTIADMHQIDLRKKGVSFEAKFTSESVIRIGCADESGNYTYYVVSAKTGELQACERSEKIDYSAESRRPTAYAQLYLPQIAEKNQDETVLRYAEASVAKSFEHKLENNYQNPTLIAASSGGEYALISVQDKSESSVVFSRVGSRKVYESALQGTVLQPGDSIDGAHSCFLSNNIVLITVTKQDGGAHTAIIKLCF